MSDYEIKYPKKAPESLIKKTMRAVAKIEAGMARFRISNRNGYRTLSLGGPDRLVMLQDTIVVFNRHKDYETFINNSAHA
jgi:hypothetical protein